jgi:hypothetical protein
LLTHNIHPHPIPPPLKGEGITLSSVLDKACVGGEWVDFIKEDTEQIFDGGDIYESE